MDLSAETNLGCCGESWRKRRITGCTRGLCRSPYKLRQAVRNPDAVPLWLHKTTSKSIPNNNLDFALVLFGDLAHDFVGKTLPIRGLNTFTFFLCVKRKRIPPEPSSETIHPTPADDKKMALPKRIIKETERLMAEP